MSKLPLKINVPTLFSKNCNEQALVVNNKHKKLKTKVMPAENLSDYDLFPERSILLVQEREE